MTESGLLGAVASRSYYLLFTGIIFISGDEYSKNFTVLHNSISIIKPIKLYKGLNYEYNKH